MQYPAFLNRLKTAAGRQTNRFAITFKYKIRSEASISQQVYYERPRAI